MEMDKDSSAGPGLFLTIEGIDGCGKTTLSRSLAKYLKKHKIPVYLTAEPSKGVIGQLIRQNLQQEEVPAAVDALLFAADRIDHGSREILPWLQKGYIVITDRYRDSSLAYQSVQGKSQGLTLDWVAQLNKFSTSPDRIYLLDLDAETSLNRRLQENAQQNDSKLEKFEKLPFQREIRQVFLELANEAIKERDNRGIHKILDATKSTDELLLDILRDLRPICKAKSIAIPPLPQISDP
ncbi:MAG: dTMP kinase [Promethearchaeota archaeon]